MKQVKIIVTSLIIAVLSLSPLTVNAQAQWSEWVDELPEEIDETYETEERTLYQYRDKSHTTSTSSSMEGWTQEKDPTTTWGSWSAWQDTAVTASATRKVETRVVGTGTYTYLDNPGLPDAPTVAGGRNLYLVSSGTLMNGGDVYWVQKFLFDIRHAFSSSSEVDGWYGRNTANAVRSFQSDYGLSVDGCVGSETANAMMNVWRDATKTEIKKTQYRYQDSTTTYYWYKWSGWSAWSETKPQTATDREINTKTQYRYRKLEKSIENAVVKMEQNNYTYTGKEITPVVTVTLEGTALVKGQDYDVEYNNNIKAGNAEAVILGKGNYTGEKRVAFVIVQQPTTQTSAMGQPTTQAPTTESPVPVQETAQAGKVSLVTMDEQEEVKISSENGGTDSGVKIKKQEGNKSSSNKKVTKGTVFESKKAKYKVSNVKNKTVVYVASNSKSKAEVKVPDTIKYKNKEYKVTEISAGAFKNNKKLKKLVIGKNVKKIGKNAFRGCKKLKSVTIGKNVVSIGAYAFYGDKNLSTVNFGTRKLNKVGKGAFKKISKHPKAKVPREKLYKYQKLIKKAL